MPDQEDVKPPTDDTKPEPVPFVIALNKEVNETIKTTSGAEVRRRITADLVEKELVRRVGTLTAAIETRKAIFGAFSKIGPDNIMHAPDGSKLVLMSDSTKKKKDKVGEKLEKLDAAIEAVLGDNVAPDAYKKLEEATAEAKKADDSK